MKVTWSWRAWTLVAVLGSMPRMATAEAPGAVEIRIGDGYLVSTMALDRAGGENWKGFCGYLLSGEWAPYHLPGGWNLSIFANRADEATIESIRPTVAGMTVSDSGELRGGKAEYDFEITAIRIVDGKFHMVGLPATALHLYLDREQAMRRMQPYGWKRIAFVPFNSGTEERRGVDVSADKGWEGYEEPEGSRLFILWEHDAIACMVRSRKPGAEPDGQAPLRGRKKPGVVYEVVDQHELTVARCLRAIAKALPEGWEAQIHGIHYRSLIIVPPRGVGRAFSVRVGPAMQPESIA